MSLSSDADALLVEQIRRGQSQAWERLIDRYEGRLLAFVESRLGRRAPCEDLVQETFLGFLTSLPNYDGRRPLESYLFAICANKLTDYLRREGRRPTIRLPAQDASTSGSDLPGTERQASSLIRSAERQALEARAVAQALSEQIARWRRQGEWSKLKCAELLFVRGWGNKQVAATLGLSEQQVANYKFEFLARLQTLVRRQQVSPDIFPELYAPPGSA